jgi:hypothetical protein
MPRHRAEVVVISWRDIPAQVNARAGDERHQVLLPYRFQKAVDRATKMAGKKNAHEHVAEWQRRSFPIDGDPLAAARAEATRLDTAYPTERLRTLIAAGGWDPSERDAERSSP